MRLLIFSGTMLLAFASGCVSVPNIEGCTVAGAIEAGADCAKSNSGEKRKITAQELIEMLEPTLDAPDQKNPSQVIKGRAGAVIITAEDYKRAKTAQELACRMLGQKCTYEGAPK